MKALWTCPLIVFLSAVAPACQLAVGQSNKVTEAKPVKKGRGKFTISKETTYVTEPVDKDGYIDYARALNRRLRQGVTPENNANVLLWKAIGPKPAYKLMPAEFFQELGMQTPPQEGEYFIDENRFLRDHLKIEILTEEAEEFFEQSRRAVERPWTAKEYPNLAAWIEVNKKPLALVVEASKRTQYYCPLIPSISGLVGALPGPAFERSRQMAGVLTTRAMLRLGQGKYDDAWQDLLACHGLGRLVGRGAYLIDSLVGIAIEGVARRGSIAFLDSAKLDAKKLHDCLRDLQMLRPVPEIAEKVDLSERLFFLDRLLMIDRNRDQFLKSVSTSLTIAQLFAPISDHPPWPSEDEGRSKLLKLLTEVLEHDIDWDPALREVNRWCDRMTAVMREKDRGASEKQWKQIDSEVEELRKKVISDELAKGFRQAEHKPSAAGKVIIDTEMAQHLSRAIHNVQNAADRIKQEQDNLQIAFALTWYHRDHGHYPKALDALAPKYLAQIPQDIFSGKPLIYRPSEKGFLLYSVGYNAKDDGGHDREDDPPGDDLVVRIPLRELPRK